KVEIMASERCDDDGLTAMIQHTQISPSMPTSPGSRRMNYGSSLPEGHPHILFQQQKQRAIAARRSRTTSWSHRMSRSITVMNDDASFMQLSNDSLASPRLHRESTSDVSVFDEVDRTPSRTFWQLYRNNMFQFGLEILYATETALVTPILLQLGLPNQLYSITWMISPILGFIFTPIIGSLSDRCRSKWGRRRPFVLAFVIGMIIGLTFLLNGGDIGLLLGDTQDSHLIGLIITLLGMFLMDFSANSGDCPARAYLIDVCCIKDTEFALSLRTLLGGSIPEVPLQALDIQRISSQQDTDALDETRPLLSDPMNIQRQLRSGRTRIHSLKGSMPSVVQGFEGSQSGEEDNDTDDDDDDDGGEPGSIKDLLRSIIYMPRELAHLCFNHFLGWLSYLVVLLFFTDYMAQAVYKGNPMAAEGSEARALYDKGVQVGCWGLCIFSFSCAITAGIYSKLASYVSHRTVYVFGQLFFATICTGSMALVTWTPIGTMVLCSSFGVMFFILLTMPSCLISVYHESEQYVSGKRGYRRGIGKDIACIGVQIFIAQIIDSTVVGPW
ncbi:putative proton-associated sugar transporter A-like, partial [Apostichopus japonicus]